MSMVHRRNASRLWICVWGGLCVAAGIASAASSGATVFRVDHQLCYSAAGRLQPRGTVVVTLVNQFSPDGFVPKIGRPLVMHCNPVAKTVGAKTYGVSNAKAHLGCLGITEKEQKTWEVQVTNQFGTATLDTGQPNLLCPPTWKSATGPPRKTSTTPPGLSHFVCYPVNVAAGAYTPPALLLKDEFSSNRVPARVNPVPRELCVPTEKLIGKRDYKIIDPDTQLLCFNVTQTPTKPKVWDENQFGTSAVTIKNTKWLCVPSTTVPVASPPGRVYWVDAGDAGESSGALKTVPIGGGSVTTLADGQDYPYSVAVDGTYAYWVNNGEGTVNKVPLGGGSVTTLASGQNGPQTLVVDNTHVYWVNQNGDVNKVPLGGGSVTTLASDPSVPTSLAVDGTYVYWNNDNGDVKEVPLGGGSVTALVTGQGEATHSVAVDGTHVYWIAYGGTVDEIPLAGGSVTTLASGQSNPQWLAVDGTHVYWTNFGDGTVNEVPLGGGSVTALASGQDEPWSVAVDATHVYWTNLNNTDGTGGTVNEVPLGGGSVTTLASGQGLLDVSQGLAIGP